MGPFAVQLHMPRVGEHFLGMAKALVQIPGLSAIHREIATIVIGVRHDAQYELMAHQALGKKVGLSDAEIKTLLDARKPGTFDESQSTVFDVAHELAYGSGPLSQSAWDNAVRLLGKQATAAVVQYVGFYSYVCTLLRGFDVNVPGTDTV